MKRAAPVWACLLCNYPPRFSSFDKRGAEMGLLANDLRSCRIVLLSAYRMNAAGELACRICHLLAKTMLGIPDESGDAALRALRPSSDRARFPSKHRNNRQAKRRRLRFVSIQTASAPASATRRSNKPSPAPVAAKTRDERNTPPPTTEPIAHRAGCFVFGARGSSTSLTGRGSIRGRERRMCLVTAL